MGYTHYWSFVPATRGNTKELETQYQKAILECQKVAVRFAEHNRDTLGSSFMSGFTAHCKPGQYGGLGIGPTRAESGELFGMREHFNQNETQDFCKTNRSVYDTAVVACLSILKYRLGDNFTVSSDGASEDWEAGVELARHVLKRKVPNPIQPRQYETQKPTDLRLAR